MKIIVVKNNIPVGVLDENEKGEITFNYLDAIKVSQYLPGLEHKINISNHLFPIFENLLPENELLEYISAQHKLKREIDVLLYLENIHGSFEFYEEDEYSQRGISENNVFIYSEVKDKILDNRYEFPNILEDYKLNIPDDKLYPNALTGSKVLGISGYQYKFSVNKDDSSRQISLCDKGESNYIMKPYNVHYSKFMPKNKDSVYIPYLLLNEHIFMTMARDFGFDVPYNAIIKHNLDYHYITKRYDRYNGLKIDHQTILTLMNKPSSEKYDISLKEAIETVAKYLDEDEILQLFRFIVFSLVISHGDLHAKNISLIYKSNSSSERNMMLAPYYDISTAGIYPAVDKNDIGMQIKNKKRNITSDDLLWLAGLMRINAESARSIIEDIAHRFITQFCTYIDRLPPEAKSLRIYRKGSIYKFFDTFEKTLKAFYDKRCKYIKECLHYSIKTNTDEIWE